MRTIFKYPIQITDKQTVSIHHKDYSKLVHAGLDPAGVPCIWAEVDSEAELVAAYTVYIVGTGNPMPDGATRHLGSFVRGPFVWHVYL